MKMTKARIFSTHVLILVSLLMSSCAMNGESTKNASLVIKEQGSFAAGGTVITSPGEFDPKNLSATGGQTLHGDHLYTFYQIPENARKLPLVFWHGFGQFSRDLGINPGWT